MKTRNITTSQTTTGGRRCAAHKRDGTNCGGWATTTSTFCVSHDRARAAEMQEARSRGGRSNRVAPQLPAQPRQFTLRTPGDFLAECEWCLAQFFQGQLGAAEVHAAAAIMNIALKALSLQVAERVAALQEAVSRPRAAEGRFDADALGDGITEGTTEEPQR